LIFIMYACLYIPDFPLQAVVRHEPALRSQAVVIVEGAPPSCAVVAANPKACQAGARLGMTRLEAGAVPSLAVRHRARAQEAAAHATLLDLGLSISPRLEDTAIDTLVLDLAGLEQLLGQPEKIARRLAERASELGLGARVAVVSNPDAAIHAARGFRGITLIPAGEEAQRLGGLPVDLLAPPPEILETLERWGVRTFQALAALPTFELSERLGQEGVRLQKLARGRTRRHLVPCEAPLHFEEVMELEYPVALLEPLAFVLGRLLDQLCRRLEARSLATHELRLRLEPEAGCEADAGSGAQDLTKPESRAPSPEPRILRLPVPTRDAKLLLQLWLLHLKSDPPPAPVLKVALAAEPARPRVRQGGLFLPLSPDPEKLEVTLARIAGVVGKGKAGSPESVDTHRPDAFQMSRFTLGGKGQGSGARISRLPIADWKSGEQSSILHPQTSGAASEPRATMALRVFRPPLPATVEVRAGRPVRVFSSSGARGEVVSAAGPWRTSGEWWAENEWRQDEWDVEILSALRTGLYRIYQDLSSGSWFIRGMYD
jgi:protein ImuB